MKKQILCLFVLTILCGYCHYGWSLPVSLDITYNISLDYDPSTQKFSKKNIFIERQKSPGSNEVETIETIYPPELTLNVDNIDHPNYPIMLDNQMVLIPNKVYSDIGSNITKSFSLQLIRNYSQFKLKLNNKNSTITIKNAMTDSALFYDARCKTKKRQNDPKDLYRIISDPGLIIQNQAEANCMNAETEISEVISGNIKAVTKAVKFVFDYENNLKSFFDKSSTPAGLYTGNATYDGSAVLMRENSVMCNPDGYDPVDWDSNEWTSPAFKQRYKFKFTINKLPKFTDYKWHGNGFSQKDITITRGKNTDIIVSARKFFTIYGIFSPLDTFVFKVQAHVGAVHSKKGCGDESQFLLFNKQALRANEGSQSNQTVCIPYKLHLTNLTCMSRIPLSNDQDKKIMASRSNIFIGALDFSFVVHCADFTALNSGLRRSLRTRNRQKTRIKDSTYNQSPDNKPKILIPKFNVQCGEKSLTFDGVLTALYH